MCRREPLLTIGYAGYSLPVRTTMRLKHAILISQLIRHMLRSRGEWVLGPSRLAAKCQFVKNVAERLFSAFQIPNLTYIEYTITGMSVKCSRANLG